MARRLRDIGLLGLIERVARRPCLIVLCYHRIETAEENPYYDSVYSATPQAFATQVKYLRDNFKMIGARELRELAQSGFRPTEPSALITFDDAYRDNFELALPILRDLEVPAAFFVPTGFLDRPRLAWWDHVSLVIKSTKIARITLDAPEPMTIDLHSLSRPEAIAAVIGPFLRSQPLAESDLLAHLDDRAEVAVDSAALGRALFATWDNVRSMADAGMIVGSHTRDHLNLARQSEHDQAETLSESRSTLERELGRSVDTLSYPYGAVGDFTLATQRIARESGYQVAFSTTATVNRPGSTDGMDVHRILIGAATSPMLFRARVGLAMTFGQSIL